MDKWLMVTLKHAAKWVIRGFGRLCDGKGWKRQNEGQKSERRPSTVAQQMRKWQKCYATCGIKKGHQTKWTTFEQMDSHVRKFIKKTMCCKALPAITNRERVREGEGMAWPEICLLDWTSERGRIESVRREREKCEIGKHVPWHRAKKSLRCEK